MSETSNDNSIQRFAVSVSLDRDEFFRRECPTCGRHFKTKASAHDIAYILQPAFRQMGLEVGEVPQDSNQEPQFLYCPYCKTHSDASTTLTPHLVQFLHRYAMREIVLPQLHRAFSGLEDSFGRRQRSSKGFISLEITFEANDITLPPRPISGPEPPDMVHVEMLCCGEHIKILDSWVNTLTCPFCGRDAVLQ